jgi:hypothetical protein
MDTRALGAAVAPSSRKEPMPAALGAERKRLSLLLRQVVRIAGIGFATVARGRTRIRNTKAAVLEGQCHRVPRAS